MSNVAERERAVREQMDSLTWQVPKDIADDVRAALRRAFDAGHAAGYMEGSERGIDVGHANGLIDGATEEREAIVAWLRRPELEDGDNGPDAFTECVREEADNIEAGAHRHEPAPTEGERRTICPGCRIAIFPGQDVTGTDDPDPWRGLWHTRCQPRPAADGDEP